MSVASISNKELKRVAKAAVRRGWRVERTSRSGHMTIRNEECPGHWHTLASSPSDRNAAQHVQRRLLRCEQGRCEHGAPYPSSAEPVEATPKEPTMPPLPKSAPKTKPAEDEAHTVQWNDSHTDVLVEAVNSFDTVKEAFEYVAQETGHRFDRIQRNYYRWMKSKPAFKSRINREVDSQQGAKGDAKPAPKKRSYKILDRMETVSLFEDFALSGTTNRELSEKYGVSTGTITSYRQRYEQIEQVIIARVSTPTPEAQPAPDESALREAVGRYFAWRESEAEYQSTMKGNLAPALKDALRIAFEQEGEAALAAIKAAYDAH